MCAIKFKKKIGAVYFKILLNQLGYIIKFQALALDIYLYSSKLKYCSIFITTFQMANNIQIIPKLNSSFFVGN